MLVQYNECVMEDWITIAHWVHGIHVDIRTERLGNLVDDDNPVGFDP